jgi:hypothetical protein
MNDKVDMITASQKEKAAVRDVRLTMRKFVEGLRKKELSLLQRVDETIQKRSPKKLDTVKTETDESVSIVTKSMSSPQSTPTSSPPLSPRLYILPCSPSRSIEVQFKTPPTLLELEDDDSYHYDDCDYNGEWGQFTCIE